MNQSNDVAAAGLFVGNIQADDPPQSRTPFALPPTTRSYQIPVDVKSDDVIRLEDDEIKVVDEEKEEAVEEEVSVVDEVMADVREDIVLAEGWSPVLYK